MKTQGDLAGIGNLNGTDAPTTADQKETEPTTAGPTTAAGDRTADTNEDERTKTHI